MLIIIAKALNEYRLKALRESIVKEIGLRPVRISRSLYIIEDKLSNNHITVIRRLLRYYASRYIVFIRGIRYLIVKYGFMEKKTKHYMAVKRLMFKYLGLPIDKSTWFIPINPQNLLKELTRHPVQLNFYSYIEPLSTEDKLYLSQEYLDYINNIIENTESKLKNKLKEKTIREYLRYITLLQERLLTDDVGAFMSKEHIITLLKKLGTFKKRLLERL